MVWQDDGGGWQWYPASFGADLKKDLKGNLKSLIPAQPHTPSSPMVVGPQLSR